jgi:formylglycine-generating enzyme required for sulfatase activity
MRRSIRKVNAVFTNTKEKIDMKTALLGALSCMGITSPALASFPRTNIGGHAMVGIPGGLTVIGSAALQDATPRWVQLSPYLIGETTVSESQYREVMGRAGNPKSPADHPVTPVSWNDAQAYLKKMGGSLDLATEVQWENAARGPAVDMRHAMEAETGRFTPTDFVDFAAGRYENFVMGIAGQIFTDPTNEFIQHLIQQGLPYFGWRVYGTPSGKLTRDEAWYDQRTTALVNWGPTNAYGLHGMTGGVWEWVKDAYSEEPVESINPLVSEGDHRIFRGGSWDNVIPGFLRAAYRDDDHPDFLNDNIGFRLAAAPKDSEK